MVRLRSIPVTGNKTVNKNVSSVSLYKINIISIAVDVIILILRNQSLSGFHRTEYIFIMLRTFLNGV